MGPYHQNKSGNGFGLVVPWKALGARVVVVWHVVLVLGVGLTGN